MSTSRPHGPSPVPRRPADGGQIAVELGMFEDADSCGEGPLVDVYIPADTLLRVGDARRMAEALSRLVATT